MQYNIAKVTIIILPLKTFGLFAETNKNILKIHYTECTTDI